MIIQDILTNKTIHRYLVKPAIKEGILKTKYGFIDLSGQHAFIQSLIFWNVYERKEIASVKKYLDTSLDIIELGSSIGYVSMFIGSLLKGLPNKFISVEANPLLMHNLKNSAKQNGYDIKFINAAICYTASEVYFEIDERNLGSRISELKSGKSVVVETTTLEKLCTGNDIGKYALVCDIEGAESQLFSYEQDSAVIDNCRQIIIELHDTTEHGKKYSKEQLADMVIKKFSMRLIASAADIWVFEK
jgi:FkbM family methyltransferase